MADQHKAHVYAWEDWKMSMHGVRSHKMAREYADKLSDPIIEPQRYAQFYWQIMWNQGFRPYIPGMSSSYF